MSLSLGGVENDDDELEADEIALEIAIFIAFVSPLAISSSDIK